MTSFDFYRGRIESCPSYGFKSGDEILNLIVSCVKADSSLTTEQVNSIIMMCWEQHKKLMEDNYNEGWRKNS